MDFHNQIPMAVATMATISIFGTIGNGIVLPIYFVQLHDNKTPTLFILVLAITDFITCIIIIPFTIINEIMNWSIGSKSLCIIYYLLNTSNIPFSSLLTICIAVDRYLCICHPFHRIMTVNRAKIIMGLLALFAMTLSCATTHFAFITMEDLNNNSVTMDNKTSYKCSDPTYVTEGYIKINSINNKIFNFLLICNHACFILCIITVTLLYILIYKSIIQLRQRKKRLQGRSDNKSQELLAIFVEKRRSADETPNSQLQIPYIVDNHLSVTPTTPESILNSPRTSCSSTMMPLRKSSRLLAKDCDLLQNIRSAAILFVVAIVYIISFIPALLMANKVIHLNLSAFYLYYLNNAANPVIYCFMNEQFRKDLRKMMRIN